MCFFFFVDFLGGCFIPGYFNSCFGSSFIDGINTCTYLHRLIYTFWMTLAVTISCTNKPVNIIPTYIAT